MDLVDRTKSILLRPKQEWQVIDGEETSVGGLFIGYIVPLAAIGPVASIIGMEIFGIWVPSAGTYRVPIGAAFQQGVAHYVMALVGVFVLALIIDELAPYFRVEENRSTARGSLGVRRVVTTAFLRLPRGSVSSRVSTRISPASKSTIARLR